MDGDVHLCRKNQRMMVEKSEFKIFMRNTIKFLTFGFKMYEQGVCDKPIEGDFKLVDSREMYGLTKQEASDLLGDLMADVSDLIFDEAHR